MVGARAVVRYGFYKLPCAVVHVTDDGKLVKVETDTEKAVYVFKRREEEDGGGYVRKIPGMVPWYLLFEKTEG
jgi:phytoene dehydrogenase-like protein